MDIYRLVGPFEGTASLERPYQLNQLSNTNPMFTGLTEEIGAIARIEELEDARRFQIEIANSAFLQNPQIGESICVSGVCLTATDFSIFDGTFSVVAVEETLRRTTLGALKDRRRINLERALRADARLGGHIVQGHVDGVADVVGVRDEGESWWITFQAAV